MDNIVRSIAYRSGYKYQLDERYFIQTSIRPLNIINTKFIRLDERGYLTIWAGYAWDGPSGPVPDTKHNMRASLIHDALYQLMRMGLLARKPWRKKADKLFRDMCIEDGVPNKIARAYYRGLRIAGRPASDPGNAKTVHYAP